MPLQQISVSPLDWGKDNSTQNSQHDWKLQETVFATTGSHPPERCASQASSLSNNHDICRICHCEAENDVPLIAPCYCAGSLRYVHQACLQQWIKSSDIRSCELCKFQFIMHSKIKPFSEWETLEMSGVERRKVLCSVTFHVVALTCVVWSLYVLIDRTAEEVHRGQLEWPFWTKLIVVAIGFTGGLVFMYIQCKGYLHLCRRWRAFNRVIFVQNAPEKIALPPSIGQAPLAQEESMLVSETCCGAVVDENACKHKDTATLTKSKFSLSLCESKVNSSSCTKGDVTSSTPLSGVECVGKGSRGGENQNELVDNSNVYQSAVMKQLDDSTGTLNISDAKSGTPYSVSSSRIDLCGRKFSYDEPSSECGEMSHLLESEDKSHHGATSIRPVSGFVLLPKFTPPLGGGRQMLPSSGSQSVGSRVSLSSSEESFPSPSVRLLQPLQRPWIVGPANSGMNWGATDTPPEQPLSSLGSQSPLLAKPTLKDDASSTN